MKIESRQDNGQCVFQLRGPLTGNAVGEFQRAIDTELDAGRTDIAVNLRGVPMIDSAGLEELLRSHERCTAAGGVCKLINAGDKLKKIFRVTRLDRELFLD